VDEYRQDATCGRRRMGLDFNYPFKPSGVLPIPVTPRVETPSSLPINSGDVKSQWGNVAESRGRLPLREMGHNSKVVTIWQARASIVNGRHESRLLCFLLGLG